MIPPLLLLSMTSCASTGARVIVPAHIYEYASKSNREIAEELPDGEALEVLKRLGRIRRNATVDLTGDREFAFEKEDSRTIFTQPKGNKNQAKMQAVHLQTAPSAVQSGYYFSTVTAVAIEEGLSPTAIPALAIGYRPEFAKWVPDFIKETGVGFDLLVGGALNSVGAGADSDSDVALALGLGFSIPWSDAGALSIGAMTWREETDDGMGNMSADTEIALYVGINIGSFNVKKQDQ